MTAPRFSVVIPTRERAETLKYCLRTCLDQTFDDYEIVICDNNSSPATNDVVKEADSNKIRYIRSSVSLSMLDNWNLAYSHTRGQYVTFLGDDDGLMPYALEELDRIIRQTGAQAVRWDWGIYTWPNVADTASANCLLVPNTRSLAKLTSQDLIADVMSGRVEADRLPNVYHSLVERNALERLREISGAVFRGVYLDTYTSFALAYLLENRVSTSLPISMIGLSGFSNCVGGIFLRNKSNIAAEFRSLTQQAGSRLHASVPDLPLMCVVLADSFLHAKEAVFPDDDRFVLDRRRLAEQCMNAMPADDDQEQLWVKDTVRQSLSDDPQLVNWFDHKYADHLPPIQPRPRLRPDRMGFQGDRLCLDAAQFGITNVAEAVHFASRILGYDGSEFHYDLPTRHEFWRASVDNLERAQAAESQLSQTTQQLQATEAELRQARQTAHEKEWHYEQRLRHAALRNLPKRLLRRALRPLKRFAQPRLTPGQPNRS